MVELETSDDPVNTIPAETAEESGTLTRALESFMRAELAAPVDAIGGYIDLLTEDAERSGLQDYAADLDRMKLAKIRLSQLLDGIVGEEAGDQSDLANQSSRLRHDLRTPIAAILGYGELLAELARDEGHAGFADTAEGLLDAARRLLAQIDAFVEAFRPPEQRGSASAEPEAVTAATLSREEAVDAIRAVLVRQPELHQAVTGEILVVDDDPSNVDLLTRRLTRDGHAVTGLTSGEEALAWIMDHPTDLVLLDLIMSGMTGVDVLLALRAREETRLTPVIIISGLDEAEGAIRCIEAGADDYLSKPVDAVLLRARIGAALERKRLRDREIAITKRLQAEQERSEALLRNVLPMSVVERLRAGETVIADHFEQVTILFCDLVGFTALSTRLTPGDTLTLLNAIFSAFDQLAADHGIEKIKTIGDAYMAAAGLPQPNPDHAAAMAAMALHMPGIVERVSRSFGPVLTVRIGMATGPVAAGIIGTDKFVYDVWGDAVNTASRMEHHGMAGRVHISEETRAALGTRFVFETLPPMEIKGKGLMQTYLLGSPA